MVFWLIHAFCATACLLSLFLSHIYEYIYMSVYIYTHREEHNAHKKAIHEAQIAITTKFDSFVRT